MASHMLVTPMSETSREAYGDGDRWCFRCRKRLPFQIVITQPIVMYWCPLYGDRRDDGEGEVVFNTGAYYGPTYSVRCSRCDTEDSDKFPGHWREWGEE